MSNLLKELEIVEGTTSYIVQVYDETANSKIGILNDLTTEEKTNLVSAINEVISIANDNATNIGDLDNLDTTAKANLVTAINELKGNIDDIEVKQVFYDISEMTSSEIDFKNGDVLITLSPAIAGWIVSNSGTPSLLVRSLHNSKYATFLGGDIVNIASLGLVPNSNISDGLQALITAGYKNIYIPSGVYTCSVTLTDGVVLHGDGINTSLIPYNHTSALKVNGNNITVKDITIQDVTPYTGNGIETGANGCNNSHFENVHIENCNNGFIATTSMIWNEFINCDFYGCMNIGFVVTGADLFFNNNSFISCKFNNNVNEGAVLSLAETKDYANVFVACNFEYNAQDRFGKTHTATCALQNTSFISLYGCYFEGNGGEVTTDSSILNYDKILCSGCCFINEQNIVTNNVAGGVVGNATFINCKDLNLVGAVSFYSNTKCVCINNTFDVPTSGLNVGLDNNKKAVNSISSVTVDCTYPITINSHNSVTGLTHAIDGQIIYIYASSYDITVASNINTTGADVTIETGTTKGFMIVGGKLSPLA